MRIRLLTLGLCLISIILSGCVKTADYGICIISPEGSVEANGESFFSMHSIVKFPQALYVAATEHQMHDDIALTADRIPAVFVPHPHSQTDLSVILGRKLKELE